LTLFSVATSSPSSLAAASTLFSVATAPRLRSFLPWCAEIVAPVHDEPPRDDMSAQDELLHDDAPVLE
jgi:hypothetical protein